MKDAGTELLRYFGLEDIKEIATNQTNLNQNEKLVYCKEKYGKYFSQLKKEQYIKFILNHITIYDIGRDKIIKLYNLFYKNDQPPNSPPSDSEKIRYIINSYTGNLNTVDANFSKLAIFLYAAESNNKNSSFIGSDMNKLVDNFPENCTIIKKSITKLVSEEKRYTLFLIRDFFEQNRILKKFLIFLSGHGNPNSYMLNTNDTLSIYNILDQWHRFMQSNQSSDSSESVLILVCDYCYCGFAVEIVKNWNCQRDCCKNIVIQTSCANDEIAYDQMFVPAMIDLMKCENLEEDKITSFPLNLLENSILRYWEKKETWELQSENISMLCCKCQKINTFHNHLCHFCKEIVCKNCYTDKLGFKFCDREICLEEIQKTFQTPLLYIRSDPQLQSFKLEYGNETLYLHNSSSYQNIWMHWLNQNNMPKESKDLYSFFFSIGAGKGPEENLKEDKIYSKIKDDELSKIFLSVESQFDLNYSDDQEKKPFQIECDKVVKQILAEKDNIKDFSKTTLFFYNICVSKNQDENNNANSDAKECKVKIGINISHDESLYYVKAVQIKTDEWLIDNRIKPGYANKAFSDQHSLGELFENITTSLSGKPDLQREIIDLCGLFGVEVLRFETIAEEINIAIQHMKRLYLTNILDINFLFPKELINTWSTCCGLEFSNIKINLSNKDSKKDSLKDSKKYSKKYSTKDSKEDSKKEFSMISLKDIKKGNNYQTYQWNVMKQNIKIHKTRYNIEINNNKEKEKPIIEIPSKPDATEATDTSQLTSSP